jgi:hypothetical protein
MYKQKLIEKIEEKKIRAEIMKHKKEKVKQIYED